VDPAQRTGANTQGLIVLDEGARTDTGLELIQPKCFRKIAPLISDLLSDDLKWTVQFERTNFHI
jgi:hypothetical protein